MAAAAAAAAQCARLQSVTVAVKFENKSTCCSVHGMVPVFSWKAIGGAVTPKREPSLQVILRVTHMRCRFGCACGNFTQLCQVNGVFMQETFSVASSDDRVMIQKRNRHLQTHKRKMKRFFNLADKSKNGSIDLDPRGFVYETQTATKTVCCSHMANRVFMYSF